MMAHDFNIPALGRQMQAAVSEFKGCLLYVVSTGQPELHSKTLTQKENKKPHKFYLDNHSWNHRPLEVEGIG